jgi:hypothetical protein
VDCFSVSLLGDTLKQGNGCFVIIPGISVANGSQITIARNRFAGRNTGLGVRTVSDAVIDHNSITGSFADGVNVTDSQRVVVSYNRCTDFAPGVGAHPDCVQLRNLTGKPLQSDVMLIGNVAIGRMQAFFGNCNRTTFISNYAATNGYTHTITCSGGVDNVAIGNVLANIDRVSNNLNAVFDADNRTALRSALADIARVAHGLAAQEAALSAGIRDAARTAKLAARAGEKLEPTLDRITAGADAVGRMAEVAQAASARA